MPKKTSVSFDILADPSKAKKALKELNTALAGTESQTDKLGKSLKTKLAGVGLGAAIFGSLKAADESLKIAHQTEAVIKSTGGAAQVTADHVGDLATSISNATGMDDEMIQSGENMLLTFKNIRNEAGKGNDIFDQSTKIMADFAAATGTDAKDAAVTLGKALNDPITGLTALRRVGVTFTQQQKDQIKAMQESGDMMGAQKIILQELTSEFGGSAAAQTSALDKIRTQVGNAAESLGTSLMPAAKVAASVITTLSGAFQSLPPVVQSSTVLVAGAAIAWSKWGDQLRDFANSKTIMKIRGALSGAGKGGEEAAGGVGMLASAGPLAATGIGLAAVGLAAFSLNAADAKKRAQETADGIDRLAAAAENANKSVKAILGGELARALAGASSSLEIPDSLAKDLKTHMDGAHLSIDDLNKALSGNKAGFDKFVSSYTSYSTGAGPKARMEMDQQVGALKELRTRVQGAAEQQNDLKKNTDDVTSSQRRQTDAAKRAVDAGLQSAGAQQVHAQAMEDLKKAVDDANKAITDFYDATTDGLSANIDYHAALDDLTKAFQDNGVTLDVNTEQGRANLQSLIASKDAAVQNAQAILESSGSNQQAAASMNTYRDSLDQAMRQAGFTDGQIAVMNAQMGLTPDQITTQFITNAAQVTGAVQQLGDVANSIAGDRFLTFYADLVARFSGSADALGGKGNAWGGTVGPGWGMVGENGPELLNGSTGQVIGAGRTQALLSGMGSGPSMAAPSVTNIVTLNIAGSVTTERDLVTSVRNELRRVQSRSSGPILAGVS